MMFFKGQGKETFEAVNFLKKSTSVAVQALERRAVSALAIWKRVCYRSRNLSRRCRSRGSFYGYARLNWDTHFNQVTRAVSSVICVQQFAAGLAALAKDLGRAWMTW